MYTHHFIIFCNTNEAHPDKLVRDLYNFMDQNSENISLVLIPKNLDFSKYIELVKDLQETYELEILKVTDENSQNNG